MSLSFRADVSMGEWTAHATVFVEAPLFASVLIQRRIDGSIALDRMRDVGSNWLPVLPTAEEVDAGSEQRKRLSLVLYALERGLVAARDAARLTWACIPETCGGACLRCGERPDPSEPCRALVPDTRCTACPWEGPVRELDREDADAVRCPECGAGVAGMEVRA